MHAEEERTVKLRAPLPVYLGYWTARVSADGVTQFRKDVYGIDRRQTALLADRLSRLRRTAAAAAMADLRPAPSKTMKTSRRVPVAKRAPVKPRAVIANSTE